MKSLVAFNIGLVFFGVISTVSAQEKPKGLLAGEVATKGTEDIATTGFERQLDLTQEAADLLELKLSFGGFSAAGNAKSLAVTSSSKLRYRREDNQVGAAIVGNYGRAQVAGETQPRTTVENVQGKLRYDRFLSERVALFAGISGLTNRFLGLQMRLNFDPGVAYYFLTAAKHRLWLEAGYDLQFDLRRDEALLAAAAEGSRLEASDLSHNTRLFLGYENNLSDTLALDTGVEYLQGFSNTDNWRLNWDVGLTSSIAGNLSIATSFTLRYDNNPLPGIEKTDYTTALSLVYQLL